MLSCQDYATVADNAALLTTSLLRLSHSMVLRLLPDGHSLLLQGGVGWTTGMVGHSVFEADNNSLMGFALSSTEPVLIKNLQMESRFTVPAVLLEHGLMSGLCIKIPCQYQSFGVLATFCTKTRSFSADDISCLRVVASMLAMSSGCQRTGEVRREDQEKISQAKQEWEATVDTLPHFVCLLDDQKRIIRTNRSAEQWISRPVNDTRGYTIHELLHPGCHDVTCYMLSLCDSAWNELLNGRHVEYETEDKLMKRYLGIQLRPTAVRQASGTKQASRAVVVVQDITKIKRAEEVLKNSNDRLESLIQARTTELVLANEQLKREIVERQRVEEALRHSENEMRLMSAQLLTAQEVERKRIASELHDGIGQSLSAIKFSMENAIDSWKHQPNDHDEKLLDSLIPKMQGAIEEVRRISMDLRPSTLDDLGVIPTIAWFCREFRLIYSGIHIETQIDVEEKDVSVPLKTVVYRIMQEALNNIVKHAKAEYVFIQLLKTSSAIEFMIRDNGVGFALESLTQRKQPDSGFGITGMRERAEFSGGTFAVFSKHDAGTIIRVSWPYRPVREM